MNRKIYLRCQTYKKFASEITFQTFSTLPQLNSYFAYLSAALTYVTHPHFAPQTSFISLLFHYFRLFSSVLV